MSSKMLPRLAALLGLFLCLTLVILIDHYANLPQRLPQQETIVLGQNRLAPGSPAAFRVLVRDSRDAAPLAGAQVTVLLRPAAGGPPITVFRGTTDDTGNAGVAFTPSADLAAEQTLIVQTSSTLGSEQIERPVTLARDYRVLLSTDKPLYQPGQVIHLRALALATTDLRVAAGQPLEVAVADGKGNRVFRQTLTTGDYGQASVDFQLASEVNTGPYKITATLGNTSSEKTVTVDRYVLPKFDVKLAAERSYYRPGERVRSTLNAAYFFGKPVAGGTIAIEGFTFDVQRNVTFSAQGATDAEGNFAFEFDLPAYIAGSDLEGGLGRFYLQATVTDLAQHSESEQLSLPVSASALVIDAVPEGGQFRAGVDNILYVVTSYPDGTPADTAITVNFEGRALNANSGAYGLAEFHVTPGQPWQQFTASARDARGASASREFTFQGNWTSESVLLRPARPLYRVGETLTATVLTSQPSGTVYFDIVRAGQTLSTRAVPVEGGRAEITVDLAPELFGTLELHAYRIALDGTIIRDTRLVIVEAARDLNVDVQPGADVYRPGDTAGLDVRITGADGAGAQAALGVAIVDESVFALAEQDPGFAKLYFLLEQELLEPKVDMHGFSVPGTLSPLLHNGAFQVEIPDALQRAAQASLAVASASDAGFSLSANSHQEAVLNANRQRNAFFEALGRAVNILAGALALAVLLISILGVAREGHLPGSVGRGLFLAALAAITIYVLFLLLTGVRDFEVTRAMSCLAGFAAIAGGLGAVMLLIVPHGRRALRWVVALTLLFAVVLPLAAFFGIGNMDERQAIGLLVVLALPALAFMLWAGHFLNEGRPQYAMLAVLACGFVLCAPVGLVALVPMGAMGPAAGNARALDPAGGPVVFEDAAVLVPGVQPTAAVSEQAPGRPAPAAEPPRVRQYFPETMLWLPDAVTDKSGNLHLDVPVADSITTWRITALASTQDGRLGSTTAGLRVFQDFFVDLDLPLALTVDDEVAVPVGVFNYLTEPQSVRLELEQSPWFELRDEPVKTIDIAANDISVVYFRVRARDFGVHSFKVTAIGSRLSDAIQKDVRVFPNGKEIRTTQSDRLTPGAPLAQKITIPAAAISGTQSLVVKVYPGVLSQVVEGLDSILRMPYGCFEQTSSTTYPNVLVLDYLRTTNQASPETQFKAEDYINLGYQRLTTFEVASSGGFSLFGNPPADRMLTAYGLQEFADMAHVRDVDPALVSRAAEWLLAQQTGDGSWENDRGIVHENTWQKLGNDRLPVTAYIVWSLTEAGYNTDARAQKGVDYVRAHQADATDAYVLGLVANALVADDRAHGAKAPAAETQAVLDRLAEQAVRDGDGATWRSGVATFMGGEGQTGSIETTALAAFAFLRSGAHPDLANAALLSLVRNKDSYGTWHSTQATVLALKALIESVRAGAEHTSATVTISLNGGEPHTLQITPDNFDVVQLVTFDGVRPGADNTVTLSATGDGNLMYQITAAYYVPWSALPAPVPGQEPVSIDVRYDRTELAVDDTVAVNVSVALNQAGQADSALIDLGVPPGFTVLTEDLDARVARDAALPPDYPGARLERYELTGRQVLVYVRNLSSDEPLRFSYRLKAKFPLVAQTPASSAYDYYNPDVNGAAAPQTLVVNAKP
jgi:uncharacterized protein YfaS (alpha-2-macroglobulin family)